MSDRVNVGSIQALQELREALSRFKAEALEALVAANLCCRQSVNWLQQKRRLAQSRVRRDAAELDRARRVYASCRSQSTGRRADEHSRACNAVDCGQAAASVQTAKHRLDKSREHLKETEHWLREVEQAVGRYRRQARRLRQFVEARLPEARVILADQIDALAAYFAFSPVLANTVGVSSNMLMATARRSAVSLAKQQEIQLVQQTGRGTRDWSARELRLLAKGKFPKGYHGHHINNIARFPDRAADPDNIRFLMPKDHLEAHFGSFRNSTSGRGFNRKSMMVQWAK